MSDYIYEKKYIANYDQVPDRFLFNYSTFRYEFVHSSGIFYISTGVKTT